VGSNGSNGTDDSLERSREKLRDLAQVASEARKVLILTHDNPDPDALASAVALRHVIKKAAGRGSVIAYGGAIGRPENRALARTLRAGLKPCREVDLRSYRIIALVDAQPETGNNPLAPGIVPAIVIDHHRARKATRQARFSDIRPDYGATSTILTEYVRALDAPVPRRLATALFYGIKSDTANLNRGGSDADRRAFSHLFPYVGQAELGAVEHARVTRQHFEVMKRAIDNAVVYGNLVVSRIGPVANPEEVAATSDELIRLENMRWAVALGIHNGDLHISLRRGEHTRDAGQTLRRAVGRMGTAGGHGSMAGAKVPLRRSGSDLDPDEIVNRVGGRLLEVLGAGGREGRPLVTDDDDEPGGSSGDESGSERTNGR